jgi:hypothetical protein
MVYFRLGTRDSPEDTEENHVVYGSKISIIRPRFGPDSCLPALLFFNVE